MYRIKSVKPLKDYRIWIQFADGAEGNVDLSDLVGKGIFSKWQNIDYFKSVFVDPETHTVAWPGGIDLCPDELYAEVTGKDFNSILAKNTFDNLSKVSDK